MGFSNTLTPPAYSKKDPLKSSLVIEKSQNLIDCSDSLIVTKTNSFELSELPMPLYSLSLSKNEKRMLRKESSSSHLGKTDLSSNSLSSSPHVYALPMPMFSVVTLFKAIYQLTIGKRSDA
ncbi:hypothetical protein K502DRAFT_326193 [Neoconidiobolus thromboides FSU 785]|nr:hypothetical protein K502DRAFT_326193 [Neoconidiobolus thromboides FSU 785]